MSNITEGATQDNAPNDDIKPEPPAWFVKRYRNTNIYRHADGRLSWRIEPIQRWQSVEAVEKAVDAMIIDAAITMSNDKVKQLMEASGIESDEPGDAEPGGKTLAH